MMELLKKLDLLSEIDQELDAVTTDQIAYQGTKLGPIKRGEKSVGKVENDAVRRLYCVSLILLSRAVQKKTEAASASSAPEEHDKLGAANRDGALAELVGNLMWAQIRRDLDLYLAHGVGIRDGWQVVCCEGGSGNPLLKLFGIEEG